MGGLYSILYVYYQWRTLDDTRQRQCRSHLEIIYLADCERMIPDKQSVCKAGA